MNARLLRPERSALPTGPHPDTGSDVIKFIAKCPHVFISNGFLAVFNKESARAVIIYDIKCENGHTFEGWFKDRQAWVEQNAGRLVCCPVCNSSSVEIAPSSLTIMGKDSKPPGTRTFPGGRCFSRCAATLKTAFEDVGNKFAEVALKIHTRAMKERNIKGTTTPREETVLKEEGVSFIKISLPKMDS